MNYNVLFTAWKETEDSRLRILALRSVRMNTVNNFDRSVGPFRTYHVF